MDIKKIIIIGSGGFSKQVLEIIEEINRRKETYNIVGIVDDNPDKLGKTILGYKVIGTTDFIKNNYERKELHGVIAISNPKVKRKLSQKLSFINWVNLIHPKAIISKYTKLGVGNVICAGTIINPECKLGNHCHINIGCTLGHDLIIHNNVTVMPGSKVSGNVFLDEDVIVGTGSTILQGLTLSKGSYLGAGAVLINDTSESSLYVGIPAKKIKDL